MSSENAELARWFAEELQPHEPSLRAYLQRNFPGLTDVDDVVQESYLKTFRAKIHGRLRSARGFLFTSARNAALDVFRRRRTDSARAKVAADAPLLVVESGPLADEAASRQQELALLVEAIESLPVRCREVLKLRKIYGLSHKEIAAHLGIAPRTVNVQLGHGVRRCTQYLRARGVVPRSRSSASHDENER